MKTVKEYLNQLDETTYNKYKLLIEKVRVFARYAGMDVSKFETSYLFNKLGSLDEMYFVRIEKDRIDLIYFDSSDESNSKYIITQSIDLLSYKTIYNYFELSSSKYDINYKPFIYHTIVSDVLSSDSIDFIDTNIVGRDFSQEFFSQNYFYCYLNTDDMARKKKYWVDYLSEEGTPVNDKTVLSDREEVKPSEYYREYLTKYAHDILSPEEIERIVSDIKFDPDIYIDGNAMMPNIPEVINHHYEYKSNLESKRRELTNILKLYYGYKS